MKGSYPHPLENERKLADIYGSMYQVHRRIMRFTCRGNTFSCFVLIRRNTEMKKIASPFIPILRLLSATDVLASLINKMELERISVNLHLHRNG